MRMYLDTWQQAIDLHLQWREWKHRQVSNGKITFESKMISEEHRRKYNEGLFRHDGKKVKEFKDLRNSPTDSMMFGDEDPDYMYYMPYSSKKQNNKRPDKDQKTLGKITDDDLFAHLLSNFSA